MSDYKNCSGKTNTDNGSNTLNKVHVICPCAIKDLMGLGADWYLEEVIETYPATMVYRSRYDKSAKKYGDCNC